MSKALKRIATCLLATAMLAASSIALGSNMAVAQDSGATLQYINDRDELIAAQESLLNVYRCRFDIDTQQVPGGCTSGQPSQGPTEPATFTGTPTQNQISLRDDLIANQESLLNVYRCRFDIDTQQVPGGCAKQPVQGPVQDPVEDPGPEQIDIHVFYCVPANAGFTQAKLQAEADRFNGDIRDFFLRESSNTVKLNFVPGGIVSPGVAWNDVTIGDWSNAHGMSPCETQIFAMGQFQYTLILAHIAAGGGTAGYAAPDRGSATVPTLERYSNNRRYHSILIGHEVGHSAFDLGHDSEFLSIMTTPGARGTLRANRIGCDDLFLLGWPQHDRCDLNALTMPDGAFTAISTGRYHSCALRLDGSAACWGKNYLEPIEAPEASFTALAAGTWHSCGLRAGGQIECWGLDDDEHGNMVGLASPPAGSFAAISAGNLHTCGLRDTGAVQCWGSNIDIWHGTQIGQSKAPSGRFSAIAAGAWHTCGLRGTGAVICWGANHDGHGNFIGQTRAPRGAFSALASGTWHTCGLRSDGSAECWGANHDGHGNITGQAEAPSGTFTALAAGSYHTCGLHEDGTVQCWGSNAEGALDVPTGKFTTIEAAPRHTCGVKGDGSVQCWGGDHFKGLGCPGGSLRARLVDAGTRVIWGSTTEGGGLADSCD